jgi:hypothetical protein
MKADQYMKMPWGKYRGFYLKDVPTDYIRWVVMNYENQPGLAQVCAEELVRREPSLGRVKSKTIPNLHTAERVIYK